MEGNREEKGQSFCRSIRKCRGDHKIRKACGISRGTTSKRLERVKQKCKRSVRGVGRKEKQITRRASEFCRKGRATLGKRQQNRTMKSKTCRHVKKEEAVVLRNQMDAASTQPCWSTSSRLEEPRQCSSSHIFQQSFWRSRILARAKCSRARGRSRRKRSLGRRMG